MSFENLCFIIKNYVKNGYKNIIVNDLLEDMIIQVPTIFKNYNYKIISLIVEDKELERRINSPRDSGYKNVKKAVEWNNYIKKRKLLKEIKSLNEAKNLIRELSYREKLILLSALYWGEGSKGDFGLSNTDPNLIRVFISCLKDVFNINKARLRVSIRIYEDLDKEKCLDFWSKVTGIKKEDFINVNILNKF
jgi:hypothetical protein